MTKLHEVAALGQAIWLDYIQRSLISTGKLQSLVDDGIRGVTSNPSIFEKAIVGSNDYEDDLKLMVAQDESVVDIYERLVVSDIQGAADVLRPLYDSTAALDGYVSLEVNPLLAHDFAGTVAEAKRLWHWIERPNVFIKVPATPAGVPAIRALIGNGINVNVTLIFSLDQYRSIAQAYIEGLGDAAQAGHDIHRIRSVASLFVSRVDGKVDPLLPEKNGRDLQGKIALANAKMCYQLFKELFSGPRWDALAAQGAYVQRPLWASTSAKNPAYPDTLYVDNLIGPYTVNTAPPATVEAFMDHGNVTATVETEIQQARSDLQRLAELGIDLDDITAQLLDEGVEKFAQAYEGLLAAIEEKGSDLRGKT